MYRNQVNYPLVKLFDYLQWTIIRCTKHRHKQVLAGFHENLIPKENYRQCMLFLNYVIATNDPSRTSKQLYCTYFKEGALNVNTICHRITTITILLARSPMQRQKTAVNKLYLLIIKSKVTWNSKLQFILRLQKWDRTTDAINA